MSLNQFNIEKQLNKKYLLDINSTKNSVNTIFIKSTIKVNQWLKNLFYNKNKKIDFIFKSNRMKS